MTSQQLRGWLFPELLLAAKYGGGWRGSLRGAGVTGGRGGVGGAVISTLTEGVILLTDPPPDPWLRLAKVGGAGTASGMTGSFTESLVNGTMGSAMARHLTTRGASSWVASSLGRMPGGGLGGGIAAPVFSMAMLALDDQQHSGTDYAAKGIRAVIPGTIAGALSAAASGALVGSAVPGLGTAIGLIVGFAGYIVVDGLVGDKVETGVRQMLR